MCGNEIRNKKFSLVFASAVLSPKHAVSEESTGKVWENKTFQGQVFLTYFARSRNPYNFQNSKHWNSEFTYYGKIMGKQIFQRFGFLVYSALLHFGVTWKPMGKHKHFKAMGFLHISCVALIHTIPKIWEKWIPTGRKKYGKTQTFQS